MLASELHVCMQCWPMSCHDNQPLSASNTVASFSRVPRRPHSVQQPTMWQTSRQQVAVCGVQPGQADAAATAARPPPRPHSVLQPRSQHTGSLGNGASGKLPHTSLTQVGFINWLQTIDQPCSNDASTLLMPCRCLCGYLFVGLHYCVESISAASLVRSVWTLLYRDTVLELVRL
jgi:hypothetical protein